MAHRTQFVSRTVYNDARVEWVLNHQFVRITMVDIESPPKYEAHVYIGFNHEKKKYVCHWLDVFGGQFSETIGVGTRDENSIEFIFASKEAVLRNRFSFDEAGGEWSSVIEQRGPLEDQWHTFCADVYKKR